MSHIFISYVYKDISVACEIANGLEAVGYATWYLSKGPRARKLDRGTPLARIERRTRLKAAVSEVFAYS